MDEKLNIEFWYKKYLNLMGLTESLMPPAQKRETKRAFIGGFGMALVSLQEDIASIDDIDEAVERLQDLNNQVQTFMANEI